MHHGMGRAHLRAPAPPCLVPEKRIRILARGRFAPVCFLPRPEGVEQQGDPAQDQEDRPQVSKVKGEKEGGGDKCQQQAADQRAAPGRSHSPVALVITVRSGEHAEGGDQDENRPPVAQLKASDILQ